MCRTRNFFVGSLTSKQPFTGEQSCRVARRESIVGVEILWLVNHRRAGFPTRPAYRRRRG